ncbi:MAG: glycosyltransferase [Patescibacteria group bacterium]|nr:glycosyltransferase [Patescibacteria group bacterium]
MRKFKSQGSGKFNRQDFEKIGQDVTFEEGVKVFNPENIIIGNNVYIGHNTILQGYHQNKLIIGDNVWIGANCYLHAAGGIEIGPNVGIGPAVKIITATHNLQEDDLGLIIDLPLKYASVKIDQGCDIGIGAIIMPGVTVAFGTQVGAGAIVTRNTSRYSIMAGVPARKIGVRQGIYEKKFSFKKNIFKLVVTSVITLIRYFFDLIFLIILPLVIIYAWIRYFLKKLFRLKPSVIISPLGSPLPFFAVKALKTQGYKVNNFSLDVPSFFRPISFDFILADHKFLRIFSYLSDYLFLFLWALLKYDIFEFAFSGGILMNSHWRKGEFVFLKLCAKKISVYGYGSDCKILSDVRNYGFKYNNAMDRTEETESWSEKIIRENVKRAQKYANVLIAGGDIIHLGEKAIMLPLATDLSFWKDSPLPKNKIINIIHSTNHRSHKGTRFIIDIISELEKKLPIKLTLLEKKTMAECREIYPKADIFIPDVVSGWHGFTAIEAMATGRPVITYLRSDIEKFHHYYAKNIPAISANPDNLAEVVTKLVKNQKLREELGKHGREYVEKYHSLKFVGALRNILYEYIWNNRKINQKIFEKEVRKRKLI